MPSTWAVHSPLVTAYSGNFDRRETVCTVTFSDAAQCHSALGDRIDVFAGCIGRAVEKIGESHRFGPFTFQCACFACRWRSIASRSFSSWTRLFLANSARSLRVSYMGPSAQEVTRAITETTAAMCQPQWHRPSARVGGRRSSPTVAPCSARRATLSSRNVKTIRGGRG